MTSDDQKLGRRGPTVLFALLLSVLLGGPAPAAAISAAASADVKQLQTGKSTVLTRSVRRVSDEDRDLTDPPSSDSGVVPSSESPRRWIRRAADRAAAPSVARARPRPAAFHARAPPAA